MDIFNSKFPNQNDEYNYDSEKHKSENQALGKYDFNCNNENVQKMDTRYLKKKQSNNSDINKNDSGQNMNNNNTGKSGNNSNASGKVVEPMNEKKMQLRVEVAKYFDNLSDNKMIELLVYIENIRPQSIRILDNDTIYIDMETFNEETFNKVFEFVKKFI